MEFNKTVKDRAYQVVSWYIESDFVLSLGHVHRLRRSIEQVQNIRFLTPHVDGQQVLALDKIDNRTIVRFGNRYQKSDNGKDHATALLLRQRTAGLYVIGCLDAGIYRRITKDMVARRR